jgi:transposase
MGTISLVEEIRPYSTKDLAAIYGVCVKTMNRWIKPFAETIGTKNGRFYSVAQVKIIFDKLGVPCKLK